MSYRGFLARVCVVLLAMTYVLLAFGGGGSAFAANATPVVVTPPDAGPVVATPGSDAPVVAAAETGSITASAEPSMVTSGGLATYLFQGTFSKTSGTGPFFVRISLPAGMTVTSTGCWGTNVVFANPCVVSDGSDIVAQMATTNADGDFISAYTIEIEGIVTGAPGDRPVATGCIGEGTYSANTADTCDSARVQIAEPGAFSKTVDKAFASSGDTVTYTISFSGWSAQDVIYIVDSLPSGFDFLSATCTGTNVTFGSPNCGGLVDSGLLFIGGSVTSVGEVSGTVTVSGTVQGSVGTVISNTASFYTDPQGTLDDATPVASDEASVTLQRPTSTATTTAVPTGTIGATVTPTSPRDNYTPEVTPTSPRDDYTPEVTPTSPRDNYTPEVTPTTSPESSVTPQDPGTQTPVPPTAPASTVTPPPAAGATVAVSALPSTGQGDGRDAPSSPLSLAAIGAILALAASFLVLRRHRRA